MKMQQSIFERFFLNVCDAIDIFVLFEFFYEN
jgi:hypothetical protein